LDELWLAKIQRDDEGTEAEASIPSSENFVTRV
jgi:hypothetical protein